MKKLFYIVAICTLIALLSAYIKANFQSEPSGLSSVTVVKTPEITVQDQTAEINVPEIPANTLSAQTEKDCECKSECICAEEDPDCDCEKTKSTCSCKDADGDIVTVESIETNNSDIEEVNPEETSEEDETVVNE
ncbi:MAG: hypothetical protein IJ529_05615 [Alphaproteobacteria bacterium]|nr:hypothetical protein [Alphaproteobacteria bacterium]MBQ8677926.1 hypothetical protein [Alphaproteobacteria bacterium]